MVVHIIQVQRDNKISSYRTPTVCTRIVLLWLLAVRSVQEASSLPVSAHEQSPAAVRAAIFNVQRFGRSAIADIKVKAALVNIINRYDLVFVMETRDKTMTSLEKLRVALGKEWEYAASEPVGRTTYKEQYVYFYRPSVVKLTSAQLYDDTASDKFEREPYMAQFAYNSSRSGSVVKATFVGAHLRTDDVVAEMEALHDAVSSAKQVFPDSEAVLAVGDFNADCSYMNCAEREAATLLNTPEVYTSYVTDRVDTTVSHTTDCAYDRVVYTPQGDGSRVKVARVKTYDFEVGLGLKYKEAREVSDHYPVEFALM